ncbi:hypothetical protein [Nocardia sp. NPDC052566]|uniref:hypothetical protein n=1 Tax=Nocardia sp. NPDC052566 TaxID=3364330 RepID=UPI0037CC709C
MITFVLFLALVVGLGVLLASGAGRPETFDGAERDAQRLHDEITTMLGRATQH